MLYRKLYAKMLGAASDAIDLLEQGRMAEAEALLKRACLDAEETVIAAQEKGGAGEGDWRAHDVRPYAKQGQRRTH